MRHALAALLCDGFLGNVVVILMLSVFRSLAEERLEQIGKIRHYYSKIGVAVIDLTASIAVGDTIRVKGMTTDFSQKVDSMQIEHANVQNATAGQSIGLKVKDKVREADLVYKVLT
jgi:putative protease